MLFGRKKFNYFSMVLLYCKTVPFAAIAKTANNLIGAAVPTLNILVTAMFLDNAVAAVSHQVKLSEAYFPLAAIIALRMFDYYKGTVIGLISTRAANKLKKTVDPAIIEEKASIKFRYYENQDSVDIMNRAADGFGGNLQGFFDQVFDTFMILSEIGGFVVILGMQLWWASIVFALTSVPPFVISYIFGKKRYDVDKDMTKIDRKAWYLSGILTSRDALEERCLYGYTDRLDAQYRENYETARLARKKVSRSWWTHTTSAGMLTFLSGIAVIVLLIPSVIFPDADGAARLSVGMFVSLVNAVLGLSRQIQDTVSDHIYAYSYQLEYLKDLNAFLSFEREKDVVCLPDAEPLELMSVEFRDVSFRYPDCEPYILKNFSARLEAGKHYAIVGVNGAGKTTIAKLLTGLYDNYEGHILINGRELRELGMPEKKALSAAVYQDFCRYPLDFYTNIAIGSPNDMDNRRRVEEAVETIGLGDVVENLPDRYETAISKVQDTGVDLSGGEWQKIALARLLVNPAPLKILDEPTAALDPISENRLYEQFGKMMRRSGGNGITVFISHRLGSTKLADEIIVLSDGSAIEAGTFEELILKGGKYAEMFEAQAQWYREQKPEEV